jgi:hypothetical protein
MGVIPSSPSSSGGDYVVNEPCPDRSGKEEIDVLGGSALICGEQLDKVARITIEYDDKDKVHEELIVYLKDSNVTVTIKGNCGNIEGNTSDIHVYGDAKNCNVISGDISVSGDVKGSCKNYSGNIQALGSIIGECMTSSGTIKSTYGRTTAVDQDIEPRESKKRKRSGMDIFKRFLRIKTND